MSERWPGEEAEALELEDEAPAESDQPFAKSNGELLHSHTQQLGHGVMTKLVDQHHESNHDGKVKKSLKN